MTITRFSRREFKFVVDADQRRRLVARLAERTAPDEHGDGDGFYPVVSLYYDNRYRDMCWDQLAGVGSRQKLRVRVYGGAKAGQAAVSFIEIKHKLDGRVIKQRIPLSVEDGLRVAAGGRPAVPLARDDIRVMRQIHALVATRQLEPACVLRYQRQALHGLDDAPDLRITMDSPVWFRLDDLVPRPDDPGCRTLLLGPDRSIVEVKVDAVVPHWLSVVLGECGCRPQSFSKYANAMQTTFVARPPAQGQRTPTVATPKAERVLTPRWARAAGIAAVVQHWVR